MSARTLFWITVAVFAVIVAWSARALPEQVPVHFDLSGSADRVVSRSQAVLEMSLLGAGLALVFFLTDLLVRRGPISLVNVPHKTWWTAPEREPLLRRMISQDLRVIATMTMVLVIGVEVLTLAVADQPDPRLGPWVWVMLAGYLAAVTGYVVYLQLKRYRPEDQ